jgi:uncharacterized protein
VTSQNLTTIRSVYDAFAKGDIAAALRTFDEDIEWDEAEHVTFWQGRTWVGHREIVDGLFSRIPQIFGNTWRIEIDRMHDCGATIIMQGRYRGIAKATGKSLAPQVVHFWDFENGRIVRFQQYTDTWLFADATGIAPVTSAD